MTRDPGDIPATTAGRNLVRALSEARALPEDAMRRAARHPERIRAEVVVAIEAAAAGVPPDRSAENLIFWGIHALSEARDTALFRPLLRLLRLSSDDLEPILGDALTATLPRVAASVFDGDVAALEAAIGDREVDEFARWSLLQAMTFLTVEGRIERSRMEGLLRRFEADDMARAGEATWAGWEESIALLGLADLAETVEAARQDGRLLDDVNGRDWFERTLAHALAQPDDRSRFEGHSFGYVEDAAADLDAMLAASEQEIEPEEPVHNPLRDIGRNDPCPCGSGKKFKKCCLAA